MTRFLQLVAGFIYGVVLGAVGLHVTTWQFWVVFIAALVHCEAYARAYGK
jgi:uncharacterized membrane protein YoaK (UPF0700 family)